MWAVAGETLCTVSIAPAPRLYSLSTVIKILPMSAGLWVCLVGGDQLHLPAVLPLPLLEESISLPGNRVVLEEAQPLTPLLVRARDPKSRSGTCVPWHRSFPLQLISWRKNTKLNQLMLITSLKLVILLN